MHRHHPLLIFSIVCIVLLTVFFIVIRVEGPAEKIITPSPNVNEYHSSMYFYDNAGFFEQSVASYSDTPPLPVPPRIFIVNQHILAAHMIARQFALAHDSHIKTVVLITQNNWNAGDAPIITSAYGWKTPLGVIQPASSLVGILVSEKLAMVDETIFAHEHGITGIVPYVAHAFPEAVVIPIVIRDGTPDSLVDSLANELAKLNLDETVIVGTIDMSHYLPEYVADVHDRLTLQVIQSFDYDVLPRLDIDTAPTLRTVLKVAEYTGYTSFILSDTVNSATIVGDDELMETTSYLTGYFSKEETKSASDATHLLFVGDVMLDRGVRAHAREEGITTLFQHVERLFLGTHAVIGNLEGTITDNASLSAQDPTILRFTFQRFFANLLAQMKFSVVSLANNHALDFGRDGYTQTEEVLRGVGIVSFGSPKNDISVSQKIVIHGKETCFVGYHDLFTRDASSTLAEIVRMKPECARLVLFAHWGDEYMPTENARQRTLAHAFIDAGADLVIGAHPHVVQPLEIYKNKAIFYSLGNFMFDQNFSYGTTHGLTVHVEWEEEFTRFTLIPVFIDHQVVKIAEPGDRSTVLQSVVTDALDPDIKSDILKKQEFILQNTESL